MLRSMYSGISGMKVNQTKLDVIGNNIANVNTTSFKSSRASFSDLLSQSSSSAQAASTTKGGTNAKQVGLGVQLASIDKIMTQGSMQSTNRSLDVAIDGEGYFMVSTGPSISGDGTLEVSHKEGTHSLSAQSLQSSGAQISYTRDGSFIRDNEGNLLTSSGYRVLGYSLTNDDSSMGATSVSPSNVTVNDTLNFTFGPGSQLNGYKIQLGSIGAGTTTSATVDKNAKTITINGDFSEETGLTADAINTALSSALAKEGISQTITASGKVSPITGANASAAITGGTDATAPEYVSCGGLKFNFTEGEELNKWSFELDDVSSEITNVEISGNVIKISGDFVNGNVDTSDLKELINTKLKAAGISQEIKSVTGSATNFSGLSATTGTATSAKAPELSSTKPNSDGTNFTAATSLAGFTISIDGTLKGNDLNGYEVQFVNSTGTPTVSADKDKKVITISGDLSKIVSGTPDSTEISLTDFNNKISTALSSAGIKDAKFTLSGSYDSSASIKSGYFANGADDTSAGTVTVGGFTIEMPKAGVLEGTTPALSANLFDEMTIVIGNINQTTTTAEYDETNNTITISGNFASVSGISNSDLKDAINSELKNKLGITTDLVGVSGSNKVYNSTKSDAISGGTVLKEGGSISALNLDFTPVGGGASLNGYKIQIGTVTSGTTLGATINESSKVITVNGDFTQNGLYSAQDICDAVNKAISNSSLGSGVGFTVDTTKKPITVNSTQSENILGGTSVQSISGDGSVYYVDASSEVKAYDGSLKTLQIPDKVKIAGSDTELAVQDYSISSNGVITATLEDGSRAAIGQIAMASFANPEGLTSTGNNLFSESVNSGSATIKSGIGTLESDNSDAFGDNIQGYLEMSNVDLAEQFTDMIVTTKAFQGAAKMITTGDDILSEIINLKR